MRFSSSLGRFLLCQSYLPNGIIAITNSVRSGLSAATRPYKNRNNLSVVSIGSCLLASSTSFSSSSSSSPSSQSSTSTRTMTQQRQQQQMIQFNHAGASPSPPSVIERMEEHIKLERSLGGYAAAALVQDDLDQVYKDIATFINARSDNEIALTESATVAWTRIFYAMVQQHQNQQQQQIMTTTTRGGEGQQRDDDNNAKKKNVILISEAEYAANVVAACQWAKDNNWIVLGIPSSTNTEDGTSTGIVDLDVFDTMLSGCYEYKDDDDDGNPHILDPKQITVVCITHIPTNSGIVNPVEEIGQRIAAANTAAAASMTTSDDSTYNNSRDIFYLVDTCQSVGHVAVDVQKIKCHSLVATGRKYLRAPRGTGFMFVSSFLCNNLMPSHIDHYGVPVSAVPSNYQDGESVQRILEFSPREGAKRFEFWESNVSNRLGLGIAIQEAMNKGINNIAGDCMKISTELRNRLAALPHVKIHHEDTTTCGIVTFHSTKLDSATIVEKLFQEGFSLSVVPATSTPLDSSKTEVPNLVRASVSYTTTMEEIEALNIALSRLLSSI